MANSVILGQGFSLYIQLFQILLKDTDVPVASWRTEEDWR